MIRYTARKFTLEEVNDIVSVIPHVNGADREVSLSVRNAAMENVKIQLLAQTMVPSKEAIQELKDEIYRQYVETRIAPGSMVGTWAAEAAGGPITQLALNSFKGSGTTESAKVSTGVEEIRELINITKNPKHPSCIVIFKDGYNLTVSDAIKKRGELTDVNVLSLVQDYEIDEYANFQMYSWHDLYINITGKNIPTGREGKGPIWMMRIYIDVYTLYSMNVTVNDIVVALEEKAPDGSIVVIPSPSSGSGESKPNYANSAIIDVFPVWEIIESELAKQHVSLSLIGYENAERVFLSQTVAPRLELTKIRGILSIERLFPIRTTVWKVVRDVKYSGSGNYWFVILNRKLIDSTGIGFVEVAKLLQVIGATLVAEQPNVEYKQRLGFHYSTTPEYNILVLSDISPQILFDNAFKAEVERKQTFREEQKRLGKQFSLPPHNDFTNASEYVYAQTEGSNLIELFKRPDVDSTKTTSNDVNEIFKLLGVEAARTYWNIRMMDAISSGGSLSLNPRHIEIISDFITNQGELDPITHKGITNQPIGPMAMASFQQPVKIFQDAGYGTEEKINSVSTAIATGQRARIGAGANLILQDSRYREMLEQEISLATTFNETDILEGLAEIEGTFSGSLLSFGPEDIDDFENEDEFPDLDIDEEDVPTHGTTVLTSGGGTITQANVITRENVLQVRSEPMISKEVLVTAIDKRVIQCNAIPEQTVKATELPEHDINNVNTMEEETYESLSQGIQMRNLPIGPSISLEEEIETARVGARPSTSTSYSTASYSSPRPSIENFLGGSLGSLSANSTSNDLNGPRRINISARPTVSEDTVEERAQGKREVGTVQYRGPRPSIQDFLS